VPLAQVLGFSTDFFPFKIRVFWNLFEFSEPENQLKKINISHILFSKSYQINSIKSCSSRSFQEPKAHSNSFKIFSEKIIQYSRTFALQVEMPWNQAACTHPCCC